MTLALMTIALTLRIALVAVAGSASAAAQAGSAQVGAGKNVVLVYGVATDGSGGEAFMTSRPKTDTA